MFISDEYLQKECHFHLQRVAAKKQKNKLLSIQHEELLAKESRILAVKEKFKEKRVLNENIKKFTKGAKNNLDIFEELYETTEPHLIRPYIQTLTGCEIPITKWPYTVFVDNLPKNISKYKLSGLFMKFGPIVKCFLPVDQKNEECKGYAFIKFKNKDHAENAIKEMHNENYEYLKLNVCWSTQSVNRIYDSEDENLTSQDRTKFKGKKHERGLHGVNINNLPENTSDISFLELMEQFVSQDAIVRSVLSIIKQKFARKKCALVLFKYKFEASKTIEMLHGYEYKNFILSVDWSKLSLAEMLKMEDRNNELNFLRSHMLTEVRSISNGETFGIRIKNLSESTNITSFRTLVEQFGVITRLFLACDEITGICKGFGFVTFSSKKAARKAIGKLHNSFHDNLKLNVTWKSHKKKL